MKTLTVDILEKSPESKLLGSVAVTSIVVTWQKYET